jgi:hypothetical protein
MYWPVMLPPFMLTVGTLMATVMWACDSPGSEKSIRPKLVYPILFIITPTCVIIDVCLLPTLLTYNIAMKLYLLISQKPQLET